MEFLGHPSPNLRKLAMNVINPEEYKALRYLIEACLEASDESVREYARDTLEFRDTDARELMDGDD